MVTLETKTALRHLNARIILVFYSFENNCYQQIYAMHCSLVTYLISLSISRAFSIVSLESLPNGM